MSQITYEQPLNERIRIFLRLEFLFNQVDKTLPNESPWDSRTTLTGLLDILNIFSRADLKSEVIKELERLAVNLSPLEASADVDQNKLGQVLDNMDILSDHLHAIHGQIGQHLRNNEFLCSIKQRSSISGGTSDIDIPVYHMWLQQPAEQRINDLKKWLAEFNHVRSAITLILGLIRDSSSSTEEIAEEGFFQQSLDTSIPFQLIRITIDNKLPYFAEISAGKHRFSIRFMETNYFDRPGQTSQDISFKLTQCVI